MILWQELMKIIEGIPRNSRSTALVIGFDGGSALLGHSTVEKFLRDFVRVPGGSNLKKSAITDAWSHLDQVTRRELLYKHTTATAPRKETIAALASMLEDRYLTAIVACDPGEQLLGLLRGQGIALERFDAAEGRPRVLADFGVAAMNRRGAPVLVDTADVFLANLLQGTRGLEGAEREQMKQAFRTFSQGFDLTFFWGWCVRNILADEVWSPQPASVYALGHYTDCDALNVAGGYTIVSDGSDRDQEHATTTILDNISTELFRNRPKRRRRAMTSQLPRMLAYTEDEGFSAPPCLLWTDDELERVHEYGLASGVAVVGVEGALVRLRVAARVFKKLKQTGKITLWRVFTDVSPLHDLAELVGAAASHYCSVVVIAPPQESAAPNLEMLSVAIDHWLRTLATADKRLYLFTPVSWAEPLERLREIFPTFQPVSLFAKTCLAVTPVQRWLNQLPLLSAWRDIDLKWDMEAETRELASALVQRHRERTGNGIDAWSIDYLHQALDIWYDNISANMTAEDDYVPEDGLESWGTVWDSLLQTIAFKRDQFDDFKLEVIRRKKKTEAEGPEDDPEPPSDPSGTPPSDPPAGTPPSDFDLLGLKKRPRR